MIVSVFSVVIVPFRIEPNSSFCVANWYLVVALKQIIKEPSGVLIKKLKVTN